MCGQGIPTEGAPLKSKVIYTHILTLRTPLTSADNPASAHLTSNRDMTPKYTSPSVPAIEETLEGESRAQTMGADTERETTSSRRQEHRYESAMTLTRTSSDRQREKMRRSHRNTPHSTASRSSNKARTRPTSSRYTTSISRDDSSGSGRQRHRRTLSHASGESSGSSSGEEDVIEDHRDVLAAARASLTSPSLISTLTSLTTATNNSGSSSGSNSTVTQASMSKSLVPKEPESAPEVPISPGMGVSYPCFFPLPNDQAIYDALVWCHMAINRTFVVTCL